MKKVFLYIVQHKQQTIYTGYNSYKFKPRKADNSSCSGCDLMIICHSGLYENPYFPCTTDSREDGRNGVFKKNKTLDEIYFRNLVIIVCIFVLLFIFMYYNLLPESFYNFIFGSWKN